MRIGIVSGTSAYWLAGDPALSEREHSSASNYRQQGARKTQENSFVRGSQSKVIDRGNILHTISFTTWRLFNTAHEAELWTLNYEASTPHSGSLRILSPIAGGGETNRYVHNCVIDPPSFEITGCTVKITYTVRGGAITSNPTPP